MLHSLRSTWFFVAFFLFVSCTRHFNPQDPGIGVSAGLAQYRKGDLEKIEYALSFRIPQEKNDSIPARLALSFTKKDLASPLVLDFKESPGHVHGIILNGDTLNPDIRDEHIFIRPGNFRKGLNSLEIRFTAGNLSLNRNDDFLYTLLVPDRARTVFPCFDQPDLKAVFKLKLEIPCTWTAVANAPVSSRNVDNGHTFIEFEPTKPLPDYLFSFAAGHFKILNRSDGTFSVNLFYRETDTTKIQTNVSEIFRLAFLSLHWMEQYTGIHYPFQKYDMVAIPSFQYGGMEHPGAILFNASRLFLPQNPTRDQLLNRANLIAHETSHIWFGDLVTMKWFNEVWLKEVFANFMADKITNPAFPEVNHELKFLLAHYPAAFSVDRTPGTNPIEQSLDNLCNAGSLYGDIIYHKAPIVMRNLEEKTGEKAFREALQIYLKRYAYGNADWNDLLAILSSVSGTDLRPWSRAWIEQPGMPAITMNHQVNGKAGTLVFSQEDPLNHHTLWEQSLHIESFREGRTFRNDTVILKQAETTLRIPENTDTSLLKIPNTDGKTYGTLLPDSSTLYECFELLDHTGNLTPLNRSAIWIMLWENFLNQRIPPNRMLSELTMNLEKEQEPLINTQLLGYLSQVYWQYLSTQDRKQAAANVEPLLWNRMCGSKEGMKRDFFNAWSSLCLSPGSISKLRQIWNRKITIQDLNLNEEDYTSLTLILALKDSLHEKDIIEKQLARMKNPDEKARLRFIAPALAADPAVRDSFFRSLKKAENREHEPWVITALFYLHHPLRQDRSINYLPASLDILEEIKNTGDIFFPGRWLETTFAFYSSPKAAAIVRKFLHSHPEYPPDLKAKILQATDGLFRVTGEHPAL